MAEALSRAEALSPGRMQVTTRADGITIINDACNASPEAMTAALQALADITARWVAAVLQDRIWPRCPQ
ncbi:glutamate ligase domain-containing protein [Micromonospora pisi]|uniref:glutamate ligase domain-containing protein n=1 Tax=Micromonospora pisi TaxID=589240 RepID=UPI001FEA5E72|nr:cyanophycin synthetase [Micromonospora pisi]